jgi:hypothetical protein
MLDARSPRIDLSLTIWTPLLIGLVLVEIRRLPPGLTALLVPYLVLMARQRIIRLRQPDRGDPEISLDDAAETPAHDEPEGCADSPGSGDRSGCDDAPMPKSPRPIEEPVTPPSRRTRTRRRTRTPEPEPSAASWVQIRPGRFVRVDEMAPVHPADGADGDSRFDEPHGAPSSDESGVTPDAGSIPAETETAVAEPEPEVNDDDKDAARTGVPEVQEIGEEATSGAPATTTFLIGCPSGDPDDPGRSLVTSGAGAEVESDDSGEEMFRAEMPEMDLGWDEPVDLPRRHEEHQAIQDQEDEEDR